MNPYQMKPCIKFQTKKFEVWIVFLPDLLLGEVTLTTLTKLYGMLEVDWSPKLVAVV